MYWERARSGAIFSVMSWDDYKKTMATPPSEQLGAAAQQNDVRELERLLLRGADIDARDARGYSPLMLAAYACHREALTFLLGAGANPESTDHAGNSVLMGAAFKGHVDMVERLLAAGADPARTNDAGLDARSFAVMFGRDAVLEVLDAPHGARVASDDTTNARALT